VANAVTHHFDRDVSSDEGPWRPVRLPWGLQFTGMTLPRVWINNEPIGPQSSVAEDGDPVRIAMGAAVSWLSGLAAYTLHTGAGVRGGGEADQARGRAANLWDTPGLDETAAMLEAVRTLLPRTLPNWSRRNWNRNGHPCRITEAQAERDLVRHYAARESGRFVITSFGLRRSVECRMAARATVAVYAPPFTSPRRLTLSAGDRLRLEPPAAIVVGQEQ
jgi:hypothetical protein